MNEDKTMSRNHAVIRYFKNNQKLLLKDNNSYTGTMVLIKNNYIKISDKKEIFLQSGRTFISAKVIKKEEYDEIEKKEKEEIKEEQKNEFKEEENKYSFYDE